MMPIPSKITRALSLTPATEMRLEVQKGRIIVTPCKRPPEYLLQQRVSITDFTDRDAAWLDGETEGPSWFETRQWTVTRLAGSLARVPRRAALSRTVGGQLPVDFDPLRWGIPASMAEGMDTIAAWNLVTAVDAFLSAGFSPAELLRAVHPGDVACTQGTGFGGMESMRKMFVGRFLDEERAGDILQESLPNVVAAHVMQSYIGGYGAMVQPVSACATAAVSIEEGWDKIALGRADVVVAGAIDDISVESVVGFGNMNATAEAGAMYAQGISARHFLRANDRRRGGFMEAEGGLWVPFGGT